jgi:hypothetical protein
MDIIMQHLIACGFDSHPEEKEFGQHHPFLLCFRNNPHQ